MNNRPNAPAIASEHWDVIVVGGGGGGLAAAISAAERGVRTLLLERGDKLGGSTGISIGSFTAAGTPWQRRKGFDDSVDALLEDMAKIPGVDMKDDLPELRAVMAAEATPTLLWLSSLGVPFVGPFPEEPHRVPRMHNVVPDSRMYIACLDRAARKVGVRIVTSAAVTALVEDNGVTVGVVASIEGREAKILAHRAVILATGDFSGNAEMRRNYLSAAARDSVPANPNSSGDGHRLALLAGAELRNMAFSTGPKLRFRSIPAKGFLARLPLVPAIMKPLAALVQLMPGIVLKPFIKSLLVVHMQPSPKLFEKGAILVNLNGERFTDERVSPTSLAHQPDAAGYLVVDDVIAQEFSRFPNFISTAPGIGYAFMRDYERARPDLVHHAGSASEMAMKLSFDTAAFEFAVSGSRLREGPLLALGPVVSTVTVTEGGVSVDTQCRILTSDGTALYRIYGVGGVAQGGMRLFGHGFHIAWAMISGRVAGQAAARLPPIIPKR